MHCRPVYSLEPGRNVREGDARSYEASPADMRVLRIVAYFLRDCKHIRARGDKGQEGEETENELVYIRNGTLVDKSGVIARALLTTSNCAVLPLEHLSLQVRS